LVAPERLTKSLVVGTPIYVRDFKAFICTSTDNILVRPDHLRNSANSPGDQAGRHSYEPRMTMQPGITFPDGYVVPAAQAPETVFTVRTHATTSTIDTPISAHQRTLQPWRLPQLPRATHRRVPVADPRLAPISRL
jgi:hypothetical protein